MTQNLNTLLPHWDAFNARFGEHENFKQALLLLLPKITAPALREQVLAGIDKELQKALEKDEDIDTKTLDALVSIFRP